MTTTTERFPGPDGQELRGRLDLPLDGRPMASAVFAHCFAATGATAAAAEMARALCAAGIAVLQLDLGTRPDADAAGAERNVVDLDGLVAAAEHLARRDALPLLLVGQSLAGAAILRAGARVSRAVAVVTIGAPANAAAVVRLSGGRGTTGGGEAEIVLGGHHLRIAERLLADLEPGAMRDAIGALRRPLLLLHAPADEVVTVDSADEIARAASHPRSFVALDGADHWLSDPDDARYAGELIAAWALRYVEAAIPATLDELVATRGVAARTADAGYRTEIRARHHALTADEPAAVGGADTGPTPYELLLAALGACTSMTLRMYADRKGWPLREALVRLGHRRVHALDEEQCENRSPRLDRIDRTVELEGELSGEQRARLLEIAARCPVHRTLSAGVRIHDDAGADGT